jgi:hypothetical protein
MNHKPFDKLRANGGFYNTILRAVMICAFLKTLTPALSRRERGKKPQSVPVLSIDNTKLTVY